jgi:hypothetical protein
MIMALVWPREYDQLIDEVYDEMIRLSHHTIDEMSRTLEATRETAMDQGEHCYHTEPMLILNNSLQSRYTPIDLASRHQGDK